MNAARTTIPPRAIRAILVDDESLLRQHLRERLERHPEMVIVGEADSVQSAVELVDATRPEVIFLDVQMPPDNGFNLLPRLTVLENVALPLLYRENSDPVANSAAAAVAPTAGVATP